MDSSTSVRSTARDTHRSPCPHHRQFRDLTDCGGSSKTVNCTFSREQLRLPEQSEMKLFAIAAVAQAQELLSPGPTQSSVSFKNYAFFFSGVIVLYTSKARLLNNTAWMSCLCFLNCSCSRAHSCSVQFVFGGLTSEIPEG